MAKPDNTLKRKEREEKEDAADGLKFVIDGAKLKCDLCIVPEGDLKVNYDTPSTQDKRTATVVEKDKTSLIFKGNCKKSPQSASPCASVMKLADWKNVGTVYFQDKFPLLLKSTIKCEYGGVDVKITDSAQRNVIEKIDTTGAPVPDFVPDFDIKFELDKTQKTVVPFGILDFKNKIENPYFSFKYSLSKAPIDSLNFQIMDENDEVIYQMTHLQTVIVRASKKPKILFEIIKPTEGPLISKTWDYQEIYKKYALFEPADYTREGEYFIHWDGFDNNDVYDSTRFNDKKLKAKITAVKDNKQKSIVVDFSTKYSQVEWADVKIDKKSKRIDLALRVNLTDGGAKGLDCWNNTRNFNPPHTKDEICDWDKVPESVKTYYKQPVINRQTRTVDELRELSIEGLRKHWGRNQESKLSVGKFLNIADESFNFFINPVNSLDNKKTLDSIPLIYNTNSNWSRSGNTGGSYSDNNLDDEFMGLLPDGVVQRISYNVGYIYYDNWKDWNKTHSVYINKGWGYENENAEDIEFMFTSAHEIGHELLQAYAGTIYSWQHKGSSYYFPQNTKPLDKESFIEEYLYIDYMEESKGENLPLGEIDLMKYYNDGTGNRNRAVAAESDVLGLIWLTKIKII